jgi:FAD/FMN-containing dehydrogenase
MMKKTIANWSNFPTREAEVFSLREDRDIDIALRQNDIIARGLGRCYGDASLAPNIISTTKYNSILSFDPATGIIECQSGVSLTELLDVFVPRGWFLPVTPGTKFITIGGAVASDVHGKNHHSEGAFSNHVLSLEVHTPAFGALHCSPVENADLFRATCGGMGLTGIILKAKFKLKRIESAYIRQKQIKASNLGEVLDLFESHKSFTYSMAWIDCLKKGIHFGRSILIVGEHAQPAELKKLRPEKYLVPAHKLELSMPFNLPSLVLNPYSIKAFNALYYAKNLKKTIENVVPYEGFFYPLDAILHWNRMYGKRGFLQYQCVIPLETGKKGLTEILNMINKKGMGSFLAVLKQFGKQESLISFPMEGYTLALDFPIRNGLFEFLDQLDQIVLGYGGRLYLSKDSRMKPEMFMKGYPGAKEFLQIINRYNPDFKIRSDLSDRLLISKTS